MAEESVMWRRVVAGVNTDPSYSNGHLCCCRIEKKEGQTENFKTYIERLRVRALLPPKPHPLFHA